MIHAAASTNYWAVEEVDDSCFEIDAADWWDWMTAFNRAGTISERVAMDQPQDGAYLRFMDLISLILDATKTIR